jgi:hypothetical protein
MSDNTIIQQGYFTSTGVDKIIPLRSDVDWVDVWNLTNIAAGVQWAGCRWHWQRELAADDAIIDFHAAASQVLSLSTAAIGFNGAVYRGISLIDSSDTTPGAPIAVAAGTNAVQPVYGTANTARLTTGTIVRIQNTDHDNLNGLDFSIDTIVNNVSFRLANAIQQAPGVVAGAAGTYRRIAPNVTVYNMFHPRSRVIANITQAAAGVVTTLVDHGYVTGQAVRMIVPDVCGMTELNGQIVTVTRLNASTFSINVNTVGYTAFAFPLPAVVPFTHAQVVPVGEDITFINNLSDAVYNTSFIGMILGTSDVAAIALASPGGTNGDIIKWVAGKSFATHI